MAVTIWGRAPQMIGVYTLFTVLTTVSVVLRTYCRIVLVKTFGIDDYLALAAWAVFVLFASFALTGVTHGTGQHVANILPPSEVPIGIKFWWLCEPAYVLCNMLAKASIAVMLLRLTVIRTHRIIIWTVFTVTELYSAAFFFLFIFQCQPSEYFWTQYTGGTGKCIDTSITISVFYGYSAITCVGDWTYAVLPYFLVWNLQMDTRSKVVVIVILALGAIASTATIIRIPYVHTLSDVDDFLYATTDVAIWSCVETGIGITTACLATLRPLLRTWLERTGLGSKRTKLPSRRGHVRAASTGFEEHNLGIRKTTRVSVDEYQRWNTLDTDGESTKSETSKSRINVAGSNVNVCPWDSGQVRDGSAGGAWAEGRIRR